MAQVRSGREGPSQYSRGQNRSPPLPVSLPIFKTPFHHKIFGKNRTISLQSYIIYIYIYRFCTWGGESVSKSVLTGFHQHVPRKCRQLTRLHTSSTQRAMRTAQVEYYVVAVGTFGSQIHKKLIANTELRVGTQQTHYQGSSELSRQRLPPLRPRGSRGDWRATPGSMPLR